MIPGLEGGVREESLLVFQLGEHWFGVETQHIERVVLNDLPRTRIPGAPPHIDGVVNHRGRALALFSLGAYLGLSVPSEAERLVVVEAAGMSAGLPVGTIDGIHVCDVADVREPEQGMRHIRGLVELEAGVVQLLDLPGLLHEAAIRR